ncbi:FaeA/PapI family transcriptional regulator [Serratia quinivorans]
MINTDTPAQNRYKKRVFAAIVKLCACRNTRILSVQATWPSTREIAEDCGFSIYKTRYVLLQLVTQGWVQVTAKSVNNSLRWYTDASLHSTPHPDIQSNTPGCHHDQ